MAALDPVSEIARSYEPDRYLSALYAPEPARAQLIALAAFQAEITRIPLTVREPLLIDIRMQWWRDGLETVKSGAATGHPVADTLAPSLRGGIVPPGLLLGMIDACASQRLLAAWTDPRELRAHCVKFHGAAFAVAARVLGGTHSISLESATQSAGHAYGLARMLSTSAAIDTALTADIVARCQAAYADASAAVARLDRALLPGFLPLAMLPVYLSAKPGEDVSPLSRWWRLWRAQLAGRLT